MKASTLFAATIAILLALGLALGAKSLGLFNGYNHPTPPSNGVHVEQPRVLVAKLPLPEGIIVTPDMVEVRELRGDVERRNYEASMDKYLPPDPYSIIRSSPKMEIKPGTVLKKEDFYTSIPDGVSKRLRQGMVGAHLTLPLDRVAGGTIQVNEPVNVILTAKMCAGLDCEYTQERSGCIARQCRVIMKRDNLYSELKVNPSVISYELEANPYRAALIEYAARHGEITLQPVPIEDKGSWKGVLSYENGSTSLPPPPPVLPNENQKIKDVLEGKLTIGPEELAEALNLGRAPIHREAVMIKNWININQVTSTTFPMPRDPNANGGGWTFLPPSAIGVGTGVGAGTASKPAPGAQKNTKVDAGPTADCPTCGKMPPTQTKLIGQH